jgi:hypothetical protein
MPLIVTEIPLRVVGRFVPEKSDEVQFRVDSERHIKVKATNCSSRKFAMNPIIAATALNVVTDWGPT